MCQGKTAIKEMVNCSQHRKVCVVLMAMDNTTIAPFCKDTINDYTPVKIFTSLLRAKDYCEKMAGKWISGHKDMKLFLEWENDKSLVATNEENSIMGRWEIFDTDLDDEVPSDFHYPPIEKENEVLRNECWNLRKMVAEFRQRNAVAATYATMWDGGKDYTREHILEILETVRNVLDGDHRRVRELYENWKKNEENN